MKTFRMLTLFGLAAGLIALIWQARTISELRAEMSTLRKDLRTSLAGATENTAGVSTNAAQARREQLELIKLRHQVRELSESLAESHTADKRRSWREAFSALLPAQAATSPGTL